MRSEQVAHVVDSIRKTLASGEVGLAIDELRGAVPSLAPSLLDTVLLLAGQFSRLRAAKLGSLRTEEQLDVEMNRLADRTLALLAELPKRALPEMAPVRAPTAINVSKLESKSPSSAEAGTHETLFGINNLRQISWIQRGTVLARSVCRVLTPAGVGTGFLVASDVLMTNHHVLEDANAAAETNVEFDYEYDAAGQIKAAVRYRLDPGSLFETSGKLDFSLVRVRADPAKPPLQSWGFLPTNSNADPTKGEHVVIVQHPNGGLKQIAMTENHVVNVEPPLLHYRTDTMAGSSGSPVFNDSWYVVAIHHAGLADPRKGNAWRNEGILISAIRAALGSRWRELMSAQ